jgi:hypothetical protein
MIFQFAGKQESSSGFFVLKHKLRSFIAADWEVKEQDKNS